MEKDTAKKVAKPQGGKVLEMPQHCHAEGCKKKTERIGFCNEHFLWFKAGLIKKDGTYPKDFDKKYIQYMRKAA